MTHSTREGSRRLESREFFAALACLYRFPGRGTPSGRLATALLGSLALALALAAPASADFGLSDVEVSFTDAEGSPVPRPAPIPSR